MSLPKGLPTPADFSAHTGETFYARSVDGRSFDFRLENIESHVANERQTNFSVQFVAPADVGSAQGVFEVGNDKLGPMEIFMVPVSQDAEGLHFEAVFNYLHG